MTATGLFSHADLQRYAVERGELAGEPGEALDLFAFVSTDSVGDAVVIDPAAVMKLRDVNLDTAGGPNGIIAILVGYAAPDAPALGIEGDWNGDGGVAVHDAFAFTATPSRFIDILYDDELVSAVLNDLVIPNPANARLAVAADGGVYALISDEADDAFDFASPQVGAFEDLAGSEQMTVLVETDDQTEFTATDDLWL